MPDSSVSQSARPVADIAALKQRLDDLDYNVGLIARTLVWGDSRCAEDPELREVAGNAPAKGSRT